MPKMLSSKIDSHLWGSFIKTKTKVVGKKMTEIDRESKRLLSCAIDLGTQILECGGDVNHIEKIIHRLCDAYGATQTDVFVITSSIVVTMKRNDDAFTQTRRISHFNTDFRKLDELVELASRLYKTKPKFSEMEQEIKKACGSSISHPWLEFFGNLLASGSFAIFFGGNILDGLCAALCGAFIFIFTKKLNKIWNSQLIFYILCSLLTGLMALFFAKIKICSNVDKVMIGSIMLLIPGISLTNGFRDLFAGDTITGMLRLLEALIQATAIACGFALAVFLGGKIL